MPDFTDLTGLAGVASALAASTLLLPLTRRLTCRRRAWMTGAVFVAALIPFNGFPLAAYVRGATGDLSITTLVLLWCALLRPLSDTSQGCGGAGSRNRLTLLALIGLAAVVFYPMALGYGAADPYRSGYGSVWFVAALLLAALAAWSGKNYLIALCIACATLAWAAGWYESGNLWDYLLDPFVSVYAMAAVMFRAGRFFAKPRQ